MMKKNGFTLAEVLITLAIIGVVASLTLPALMTNTQEQQAKTALKKALNTLTEVGNLNAATNGFDYSTMKTTGASYTDNFAKDGSQTFGAIVNEHLNLIPDLPAAGVNLGESSSCAVLTDGTAVCTGDTIQAVGDDIKIIYVDTNGTKGPNKHSSCAEDSCTTAADKHIYDQFAVTLYGGSAYPGKWTAVRTLSNDSESNAAVFAAGQNKAKTSTGSGS